MWRKWTLGIVGISVSIIGLGFGLAASLVHRDDMGRLIIGALLLALNGALIWRVALLARISQEDYEQFQFGKLRRSSHSMTWKQWFLARITGLD